MMPVNYDKWRFYLDVLVLFGVIANTVYTWWANRARINNKRFTSLEKSVAGKIGEPEARRLISEQMSGCSENHDKINHMGEKISLLQLEVGQMPGRKEIASLNKCINALTEKIAHLDGKFEGVNRAVDLINEHLINQGDK